MPPQPNLTALAHIIQLAIAPVFLISGVSALLTVFTNRLSRIVDRARFLSMEKTRSSVMLEELHVLNRRARLIHRSITLATTSALLISMVIVILFLGVFLPLDVANIVGFLFVGSMITLISGLVTFLKEVRLATFSLCFNLD